MFHNLRKSSCLWDNVEEYGIARQPTDGNRRGRMLFARWTTKATDKHPEYVTLIAFPRKQWLYEHASVVRLYLYCLSVLL